MNKFNVDYVFIENPPVESYVEFEDIFLDPWTFGMGNADFDSYINSDFNNEGI